MSHTTILAVFGTVIVLGIVAVLIASIAISRAIREGRTPSRRTRALAVGATGMVTMASGIATLALVWGASPVIAVAAGAPLIIGSALILRGVLGATGSNDQVS